MKRDQYGNCVLNPVAPTVCQDNAHFKAHFGCVCDDGFVASGAKCVKPCNIAAGFTLFPDGSCKKCLANERAGTTDCECVPGFYKSNGVCVNTVICGDNEFKDHYDVCQCVQGAVRNASGFCRLPAPKIEHIKE